MKKLIINADDFGADQTRTAGIMEAVQAGVVTSVSLLANGRAFAEGVAALRHMGNRSLSVGLHVNLSEGNPLTEKAAILVDNDGRFRGKQDALSLFETSPSAALVQEIDREIIAQARRLVESGLTISHIDGHQHVHIFPALIESVLRVAADFSISWIRLPDEEAELPEEEDSMQRQAQRFRNHAVRARQRIADSGLHTTDHFRGLYLKGKVNLPSLLATLDRLPEGVTELMVHPGRIAIHMTDESFGSFGTMDRERELEALLSGDFRRRLAECAVQLTSFGELNP